MGSKTILTVLVFSNSLMFRILSANFKKKPREKIYSNYNFQFFSIQKL